LEAFAVPSALTVRSPAGRVAGAISVEVFGHDSAWAGFLTNKLINNRLAKSRAARRKGHIASV